MKKILYIWILYLPLHSFILFSCASEEEELSEPEVVQEELEEEEVDPFYAVIDENSTLEEYWDLLLLMLFVLGKLTLGLEEQ